MKNSLVSIISPSFNSSAFIKDTINSVISQTYTNWEMIIVDDLSTDDSVNIIKDMIKDEPRIRLIALPKNIGAAQARNKALNYATGKYIAFLDADDIWFSDKLEAQISFMKSNNYYFSYSSYIPISEDGKTSFKVIPAISCLDYDTYCKNTIIGCLTVVINKNEIGDFRMPNIRSSHDMALWLLIMKRGYKAYGLNIPLAKYRIVSSSNTSKKYKAALEVWDVYRKVEKLSILQSFWYFIHYALNAIKKRI